ncbi:SIMPL domain-containing protein [Methanosphaerula subterraneus]|uniref:SIMPL domain-containing protein n=1 Tax=Methanosphaerula subterraneus TaxID=3350244 RepID=UPI003F86916C
MKHKFLFLIGLLVVLGATAMISTAATTSSGVPQTDQSTDRLIHTQATGEVQTAPDRAEILFSVETQNADVKAAQAENAQRMSTCTDALKKAGIPNESLQTTGYSITPIYSDQATSSSMPVVTTANTTIQSYRVTNTLKVKLTDVNRAGEVIDLTTAAGANRVDSLSFSLSDAQTAVYRKQVITEAVNKTRPDAEAAAAALGVSVGQVQDVSIDGLSTPVTYASLAKGIAAAPAATPSTPITPGTITVTAQVSVVYLIA